MPDRGTLILIAMAFFASFTAFYAGGSQGSGSPKPAVTPPAGVAATGAAGPNAPAEKKDDPPKVELLIAPPAKLSPAKDGRYQTQVFLREGDPKRDREVTVRAEWVGIKTTPARSVQWIAGGKSAQFLTVRAGTLNGAVLDLGDPVAASERGYLRVISCAAAGPSGLNDCVRIDQALELEALPSRPDPLVVPAGLTVVALAVALAILLVRSGIGMGKTVDKLFWSVGDSYAANLNIGATVLNSLAAMGMSFELVGSKYSKTEFVAWAAFYALCSTLAPLVFNLLKHPDSIGKPVGSVAGFLMANVLNLFGVFGQLFMAYELFRILPSASIIQATAAEYLMWLPVALMALVFWYVIVAFLAVRGQIKPSTVGGGPGELSLRVL